MPKAKAGDHQDLNTIRVDTNVESPNVDHGRFKQRTAEKEWQEGPFIEREVQLVDEGKVLEYWQQLGGRDAVSGIPEDFCHVLRILEKGKKPKKEEVMCKLQFVGCSAEKGQVYSWPRAALKYNYPELLQEWEEREESERGRA